LGVALFKVNIRAGLWDAGRTDHKYLFLLSLAGHLTVSERFTNKPVTHNHRGTKVPGSEPKPDVKAG
jgi:hypothetical protein